MVSASGLGGAHGDDGRESLEDLDKCHRVEEIRRVAQAQRERAGEADGRHVAATGACVSGSVAAGSRRCSYSQEISAILARSRRDLGAHVA